MKKKVIPRLNLIYFYDRYRIPGIQVSLNLKREQEIKGKKIFSQDIENFLLDLKV